MMRRRGGIVRTVGRTAVVAGTASAVAGGVHRRQSNKWSEKDQAAADAQASEQQAAYDQGIADAQPAAAPAAADDDMAQVQKLATMHSQGLLTDEEFAAAKAKALGI